MKILQVCGSYSWGGLEMQTLIISNKLAEKNNEVTLICPDNSKLTNEEYKNGLIKYNINFNKNYFSVLNQYIKAFKTIKPDIIHSQLSRDLRYIVPALKILNLDTPLVFTKRMASKVNKKDIVHRFLYKRVNKFFAISEYIKTNMAEVLPVSADNIEVLYNGINLEKFNPALFNRKSNNANTVIGIIGRFSPLKGHVEFIDAMAILKQIIDNIKIMFVGSGGSEVEYFNKIKNYAFDRLGQEDLIFTGFTNEIPKSLSEMDVLVFPSYEESLGNVVLESMAMGVPVVASNSGAIPEIISHNVTGILFKPKDANAIADGIMDCLNNKDKIKLIIKNASNYIRQNHNFDNYIDKLQNSYSLTIKHNKNKTHHS